MPGFRSGFLSGMTVGGLLLAAGITLGGAARPQTDAPVADVVRARAFEVVDELGTVRLIVGTNADGGSISVRDRLGRPVMVAGAARHGGVIVVNNGERESPAVMLGATERGGGMQVFDRHGYRVFDALADEHGGVMTLAAGARERDGSPFGGAFGGGGEGGRPAVRLAVDERGGGTFRSFGPGGGTLVEMHADPTGAAVLGTYHATEGHALVTIESTVAGHGQIKTMAPTGAPLVTLTATANDEGQFYTRDATGKPLVAIASRPGGPSLRVYNADGEPVVTLESDEERQGKVGVWRPDGTGRALSP